MVPTLQSKHKNSTRMRPSSPNHGCRYGMSWCRVASLWTLPSLILIPLRGRAMSQPGHQPHHGRGAGGDACRVGGGYAAGDEFFLSLGLILVEVFFELWNLQDMILWILGAVCIQGFMKKGNLRHYKYWEKYEKVIKVFQTAQRSDSEQHRGNPDKMLPGETTQIFQRAEVPRHFDNFALPLLSKDRLLPALSLIALMASMYIELSKAWNSATVAHLSSLWASKSCCKCQRPIGWNQKPWRHNGPIQQIFLKLSWKLLKLPRLST